MDGDIDGDDDDDDSLQLVSLSAKLLRNKITHKLSTIESNITFIRGHYMFFSAYTIITNFVLYENIKFDDFNTKWNLSYSFAVILKGKSFSGSL